MIRHSPSITKDLLVLRAGKFTVGYQNGFIRRIHYGEIEVIRSIYVALRDQNWGTYEHVIENEHVNDHHDHFNITYTCYYESGGQKIFQWNVEINGNVDGLVTFEVQGEALTDVLKNRAGICVLHPIKHTAGYPCEMLQADGSRIKKTFPVDISAENPFKNLAGFRWRCHHDWYVLHFEGDIFETEDQRNWSDASYKTFCTPLDKPFPVLLKAGVKVHQKVMFQSDSELLDIPAMGNKQIEIVALEKKSPLPAIGIAASTEIQFFSSEMTTALSSLQLSHYRIEVQPSQLEWKQKFALANENAIALKLPLEIALHISDPKDLDNFYIAVKELNVTVKHIILLSVDKAATDQSLIKKTEALRKVFPLAKIGAGTDHNYRELNCNLFDGRSLDFISYSIDPQEHATDDLTIIENIAAQGDSVNSARSLYGENKPIHISSLTLKKRFNPAATISKDRILTNEEKADPRQQTTFAAAFTLGSIKTLSQALANSVTLYQTVGSQGILSVTGERYPVYEILSEILSDSQVQVVHTVSSRPLHCDALLLQSNNAYKILMANFTASSQQVVFRKDEYVLKPHEIRVETIR
jgi:D-apionolactonase